MAQVLDLSKSVYEICTKYPVIKGLMAENGFAEITEPGRLQTMGRFMTIPKGCDHKGVALEELKAIFRSHGFTILGDEEPAAAETPADEKPAEAENAPIAQTPEERKALIAQYLERLNDSSSVTFMPLSLKARSLAHQQVLLKRPLAILFGPCAKRTTAFLPLSTTALLQM